jgi:hypothetical protein
MAHTNQTPNYGLSEFIGSDKPAWLIDYNGDMEKIDLGLKAAKDVADAAKDEADQGALDIAAVTITANSADAKATGAVSDLADAYDSTSTYNVGDFVIYNNILYRCITAITVPESFDGTHWVRTTVEEIITQINSNLATKQAKPVVEHERVNKTFNGTDQTIATIVVDSNHYVMVTVGCSYVNVAVDYIRIIDRTTGDNFANLNSYGAVTTILTEGSYDVHIKTSTNGTNPFYMTKVTFSK